MLHRPACPRVNGVGVFAPVPDIELPVVAGRDYAAGLSAGLPDSVQVGSGAVVPVHGAVDADFPGLPGRVDSLAVNLTYVHQHILHAHPVKVGRHLVAAVSLGYGIEVQYRKRSRFKKEVIPGKQSLRDGIPKPLHPAGGQCRRHDIAGRQGIPCESEAPDIEKRSRGDVQGPAGFLVIAVGLAVHFAEHPVRKDGFTGIETAEYRTFVVSRQCGVDGIQYGVNAVPDGFGTLAYRAPGAVQVHLYRISSALGVTGNRNVSVSF